MMFMMTFKKFNEELMFSFFKKKDSVKKQSRGMMGKIVCIDTSIKSPDGYSLRHVYQIQDLNGKIGRFLGNIKYSGRIRFFRKSSGKSIIEEIENWEDISESDLNLMKNV